MNGGILCDIRSVDNILISDGLVYQVYTPKSQPEELEAILKSENDYHPICDSAKIEELIHSIRYIWYQVAVNTN